jgi:hypothetical protein
MTAASVAIQVAVQAAGGDARALDLERRRAQPLELSALLLLGVLLGGALRLYNNMPVELVTRGSARRPMAAESVGNITRRK